MWAGLGSLFRGSPPSQLSILYFLLSLIFIMMVVEDVKLYAHYYFPLRNLGAGLKLTS